MEKPDTNSNIAAQGTEEQQPPIQSSLPSKSAIRKNFKKQMAQLRQEARSISDKEMRIQIFRIIRSVLAVIDDDYDQNELLEIARKQFEFVSWAVRSELAVNKAVPSVQQEKEKAKKLKPQSDIAIRKREVKAKSRAQLRSIISQTKRSFKNKMAELAEQATQIENEKLRTDLLNLKNSFLRDLREHRNWDELFEFVESSTDMLRTCIATGLYGHLDPRTKKIFKIAEARAMDRAHRRGLGMY